MRRTVLIALAAAVLAGCSSGTSKPAATDSGASSSSVVVATSGAASATPPTAAPDGVTGFGAVQAVWDAHHTADADKAGSGVYNPDPALPKTKDGQPGDEYVGVTADGGRVDAYFLRFSARSTADALAKVKAELPLDATLIAPVLTAGLADSKCLVLTATSARVGKALGGPSGDRVLIELQSRDATMLDQDAIVSAALVSANKGDAPGC